MFDVGLGELLILAVLGLLIFGPERLPKAAADGARMLRNLRSMATSARRDLSESAGVDLTDARDALREIRDLHPRRMAANLLSDDDGAPGTTPGATPGAAPGSSPAPAPATPPRFDPDAT